MITHTAIFHCQECGRIVYQPRGLHSPVCCGTPMMCAVSDVVEPGREEGTNDPATGEVAVVSQWCHSVIDEDTARYAELGRRLRSLHDVLLERFNREERVDANLLKGERHFRDDVIRLGRQQRDILEGLDHLIHDVGEGEAAFRAWAEVCDRVDSFALDYRRHEGAEAKLEAASVEKDLGVVNWHTCGSAGRGPAECPPILCAEWHTTERVLAGSGRRGRDLPWLREFTGLK